MFTIGSLSLDICPSFEGPSEFTVLPLRCWRESGGGTASIIPFPPEFEAMQKSQEGANCELIARVESQGCCYFIIKSDHSAEFTEASRDALKASMVTIAQHPGRVFCTTMLFSDMPCFRGVNRLFFKELLAALQDRDRCIVVADKEAPAASKMLQAVVGELSLPSSNGNSKKPVLTLPPPPLSMYGGYAQDVFKRPREDCPSPTSQNHLRTFLKCPKLAAPEPFAPVPVKKNLVTLQEEDIMCVVCYDITPDVLASACCGGLVCKECIKRITSCPVCRLPTQFAENVMIKKIVNNITVTCECGRSMSWADLRAHKEYCNPRKVCPVPECRDLVFTEQSLKDHLHACHCKEILKLMARIARM